MIDRGTIPQHELPAWMRQAQRGIDWGALIVLVLAIIFAWPFISGTGFPQGVMTQPDVFRAADYAELMANGHFFPRWSPHTFNGYGAPIAHFYPPGAAYLSALIDIFFTDDIILSIRIVYSSAIIIASSTLYAFVSHRHEGVSGVLAALAFLTTPYLSLTIPHVYGDLSQMIGVALLPIMLWCTDRLLRRSLAPDMAMLAVTTAFMMLTAPSLFLAAIILLSVLLAYHIVQVRDLRRSSWVVLALTVGGTLSAFYWLPAILETNLVRWQAAIIAAPTYRLDWVDLLPTWSVLSEQVTWHPPIFSLGWGLSLIVLMSIPVVIIRLKHNLLSALYLIVSGGLLASGFLFAPLSSSWLPVAILGFIVGSSSIGQWLRSHWLGYILIAFILLFITIDALGVLSLPTEPIMELQDNPAAQGRFEAQGNGVSVLQPGLSIPSQIPTRLIVNSPTEDPMVETGTERMVVISGDPTRISALEEALLGSTYQYESEESVTLTYLQAYYAGWQANLNDERVPLNLNVNGLITFSTMPAQGILEIEYGSTWQRMLGWLLTGLSVLLLILAWWWRWRTLKPDYDQSVLVPHSYGRFFSIVCVLALVIQFNGLSDELFTHPVPYLNTIPHIRSDDDGQSTQSQAVQLMAKTSLKQVANQLEGMLFWQMQTSSTQHYMVTFAIYRRDASDAPVLETNSVHLGYFPYAQQLSGRWIPHPFVVDLPADLAAGAYRINANLYRCQSTCVAGELPSNAPLEVFTIEMFNIS